VPQQLSVASTEYVRAYVRSTVGGVNADPTLDTVQMGFVPSTGNSPGDAPATFYDAVWEPNGPDAQGRYIAACLIGPDGGTATLAAKRWQVWIKISDDPETPVLPVGILITY
jgi:hypothetical protein